MNTQGCYRCKRFLGRCEEKLFLQMLGSILIQRANCEMITGEKGSYRVIGEFGLLGPELTERTRRVGASRVESRFHRLTASLTVPSSFPLREEKKRFPY